MPKAGKNLNMSGLRSGSAIVDVEVDRREYNVEFDVVGFLFVGGQNR